MDSGRVILKTHKEIAFTKINPNKAEDIHKTEKITNEIFDIAIKQLPIHKSLRQQEVATTLYEWNSFSQNWLVLNWDKKKSKNKIISF